MRTLYFHIPEIMCFTCTATLEEAVHTHNKKHFLNSKQPQWRYPRALLAKKCLEVSLDEASAHFSDEELYVSMHSIIEQAGFTVSPNNLQLTDKIIIQNAQLNAWRHAVLGALGILCGVALLSFMLVSGPLPLSIMIIIGAVSLGVTLILGAEFYANAARELKRGEPAMDVLFAISTLTVVIVSCLSFVIPGLPLLLEVGLLVFGFRHLGLAIKHLLFQTAGESRTLQSQAPQQVLKWMGDKWAIVAVSDLEPNDCIVIESDGELPVDGHFCEWPDGTSTSTTRWLATAAQNGASTAESKELGALLLAGMRLQKSEAAFCLRTTGTSYLKTLDLDLRRSHDQKAPVDAQIQRLIMRYFIPSILLIALSSGLLIGFLVSAPAAISCVIGILVAACPCTIGLIAPLTLGVGMQKFQGIRVLQEKSLQLAADISVVMLDLNGTLTCGEPSVDGNSCSIKAEDWAIIMQLEAHTAHPVGRAIYNFAKEHVANNTQIALPLVDEENTPESREPGVIGVLNEVTYYLGNAAMMEKHGISYIAPSTNLSGAAIYLAKKNAMHTEVLGHLVIIDELRPHARTMIKELKERGLQVVLCTGADAMVARNYANLLAIDTVYANVRRDLGKQITGKEAYVRQLQAQGERVLVIGDHINDADAMAAAEVAVVLQHPKSAPSLENIAGAIIQNELAVITLLDVAQQTMQHLRWTLTLSLIYNVVVVLLSAGILLTCGLMLNPGLSAALMCVPLGLLFLSLYGLKQRPLPVVNSLSFWQAANVPHPNLVPHQLIPSAELTI